MTPNTKPQRKFDWYSPAIPALCIFQSILIIHAKANSLAEFVANTIMATALCYLAFSHIINVMIPNSQKETKQ